MPELPGDTHGEDENIKIWRVKLWSNPPSILNTKGVTQTYIDVFLTFPTQVLQQVGYGAFTGIPSVIMTDFFGLVLI